MFPKIMNDENFFKKAAAHGEEPPLTPQNEHQRSGLRFARRVRLPRAVGLAGSRFSDENYLSVDLSYVLRR